MSKDQTDDRFEEYFVIRIERQLNAEQSRLAKRDIFLGPDNQLVPIKQALRFTDADQAAQHIEQLGEQDRYEYVIQFCSHKNANESPSDLETLINQIMEIPYPYRRSAYNWLRGRDVPALLRRESEEVYERHRRMLLDYDIDITRKSDIILMKPRRKKFNIDYSQPEGSPRQYFAYPGQKPLPVPSDEEDK